MRVRPYLEAKSKKRVSGMRWIFRLFFLLIILVAVAVVSILLLPADRIAKLASEQISNATGRQVTMTGDTAITFYPILGVRTGKVTVANADWSNQGPMFTAESLKVGVKAEALWGGEIRITGLEAIGPKVHLERAADGRVNWELGVDGVAPSGQQPTGEAAEGAVPAQASRLSLTLDRAVIENATLIYDDHATGERTEMSGMRLDLRWPDFEGRATFDATVRPAGEAVRVTGYLDRVGDFIDGAVTQTELDVSLPGGDISFAGDVSVDPQASGTVSVKLSDTNRALAALGQPPADIPAGFGRSIDAKAQMTFTSNQTLSLRDLILDLGGNRMSGSVDLALAGDKPNIKAQLNAGALDLRTLTGGGSTGSASNGASSGSNGGSSGGTAATGSGWSTAPIDASALGLANAEIALSADSINTGDLKIGATRTKLTLDRSRLVFELRDVQAYDAKITGQFVLNNRSGLSVGGNMNIVGINLETFLTDAADVSSFSAKADASFKFLGSGQSQHAIMNSLSGDGRVKTGRGVISGFDLDRLMRTGNGSGGTTVFDEMSASYTMQNGFLQNDDLKMSLPLARAEGKGAVGVGARTINYLFTPVLLEGENSKGLAIPVRIKGSWDNPSILPDLGKAIDLNLKEEKEKLEQKAKEELKKLEEDAEKEIKRTVEKELGVEIQEGQKIEDALQKTLEEEALKGLKKLFD